MCRNRKAVKSIIILLLLLLPLCLLPLHCEAAEITAEQLTALEVRLNRLDEINRLSLTELQTLKRELAASQQALTEARKQSAELTAQLAALKATSKKQEALLQTAEKSSAVLEKTQAKKTLNEYAVQIDDFNVFLCRNGNPTHFKMQDSRLFCSQLFCLFTILSSLRRYWCKLRCRRRFLCPDSSR